MTYRVARLAAAVTMLFLNAAVWGKEVSCERTSRLLSVPLLDSASLADLFFAAARFSASWRFSFLSLILVDCVCTNS